MRGPGTVHLGKQGEFAILAKSGISVVPETTVSAFPIQRGASQTRSDLTSLRLIYSDPTQLFLIFQQVETSGYSHRGRGVHGLPSIPWCDFHEGDERDERRDN